VVGQDEISNLEIAQRVAAIMNRELKYRIVGVDTQRPGHDFRYSMSNKYMASLGWTPKLEFDQRLKQHVDWTLNNQQWLWM
jgi:dTDP-glucose 4,6-dehydratase